VSEGEDPVESGGAGDTERLAELRAAFQRGDYRATREGARRLAASSLDERVRAAASELAARTEASGAMIAVYLGAAGLVVAVCGYWVVWGR
jgi:hypothetical protein